MGSDSLTIAFLVGGIEREKRDLGVDLTVRVRDFLKEQVAPMLHCVFFLL